MSKKALLIGVNINNIHNYEESIKEMINLSEACNITIEKTIIQNLRNPNKSTFINSGKILEIQTYLNDGDIDTIVIDHELSPTQLRNLENLLDAEIIDKTYLILKIFELRAESKEAKLQVEIAKLKFLKPRLVGTYSALDKQKGGSKNKGRGEKKQELDTRNIEYRITSLERQLKEIEKTKVNQKRKRNKGLVKSVALVGYTNAGKSSIMNAIMLKLEKNDKTVYEKDQLFATLNTSVRSIKLANNHEFILSDTVGFVSDLPHQLVKSFNSTLKEAQDADLLLHVIDYNNDEHLKHIETTNKTLREIGANEIPELLVYNKCDLKDSQYPKVINDSIYISSKDIESIDLLLDTIDKLLYNQLALDLLVPYFDGRVINELNNIGNIIEQINTDEGYKIKIELEESIANKYQKYFK